MRGTAQAEKLVAQFEELGCVLGDLGLAFIKIAKYEDEEGAKTGAYTDSSAAARDISANTKRVGMVRSLPHAGGNSATYPVCNLLQGRVGQLGGSESRRVP